MNTHEKNYWTSAAHSFKWRVTTREVPVSGSEPTAIGFGGAQPFGITSTSLPDGNDLVVIPHHAGPAWSLNRITIVNGIMKFEVSWIHGAMVAGNVASWRGGLPMDATAHIRGGNRAVTAFMGRDLESIYINRYDRGFFRLTPRSDGKWNVSGYVPLPECSDYPYVYSASLGRDLLTVEANAAGDKWRAARYVWNEETSLLPVVTADGASEIPKAHYGIGRRDGYPLLVTGTHAVRGESKVLAGIYQGRTCIVPGIVGSGVTMLSNGGLLVAQFGWEEEGAHMGEPGRLVYVPPSLLK